MPVISLISNPERPCLDRQGVEGLCGQWGGESPTELATGIAWEFAVPGHPAGFDDQRKLLFERGIDLNILADGNRRKRFLSADMDSTIIEQECLDEMAFEAGVGARVARITSQAMNGEIDFAAALRERVSLFAGLPSGVIDAVWTNRISFTPGASELVSTMRAGGAQAILISGGFTDFTGRVAERLGFHRHYANGLVSEGGRLTGKVIEPPLGKSDKKRILGQELQDADLPAREVLAVGDGSNDIDMLEMSGLGVAFRAKPAVNQAVAIQIRHGDLTGLLYLQGYCRSEFVSMVTAP